MSKTKAGPIAADRLKSFIERIEKLEEEKKAIGGDIRDVYAEAKGVGYDVKTMRKIVQLRRLDAAERDEQDQLLDVYAHALGMVLNSPDLSGIDAPSADENELMELAGRVVAEVDRCMALAVDGRAPKIADIQALIGCSAGKAHKLRNMVILHLKTMDEFSRSNAIHDEKAADARPPCDEAGTTVLNSGPGSSVATLSNGLGADEVVKSCGGGESRPAAKLVSQDGKGAHREACPPSSPVGRHCLSQELAPPVTDDTAGVAPGPQDPIPAPEAAVSAPPVVEPTWDCPMRGGGLLSCGGHAMRTIPALNPPLIACTEWDCPYAVKALGVDAPSTPPLGAVGSPEGDRVARPKYDPEILPEFLRRTSPKAAAQ